MAKQQNQQVQQNNGQPNITLRSQMTRWHHLFKCLVATCKKNMSYKWGEPNLIDVEHVHFFHTINSNGLQQTTTNHVGGHFHEVSWSTDKDGNLVAQCGPALKKVTRQGKNGLAKTNNIPVKIYDKDLNDGEGGDVIDKHTHEMVYLGSDEISTAQINESRKSTAVVMQSMGGVKNDTFENDEVKMAPVSPATRSGGKKAAPVVEE